jgi:selenocysteine-specific elongation factor
MNAGSRYITVGVAGHVDHGKTSLVRALTDIDTDRLKEEKGRGLSIESGVALLSSNHDISIALMDVPGHTDFLKNTIRGLSCVDFAVLVVAADDGVMPQTLEHLHILALNGVKDGCVVLSKADLVDKETLEMAELELRDALTGSFLDGKRIMAFSALDGRGVEEIRRCIYEVSETLTPKDASLPFRLWIDRIRGFPGFGTVVSGTVLSGTLKPGDPLAIMPAGIDTKARSLESHHEKIPKASAGQRIGINLHKVPMDNVKRGMVASEPASLRTYYKYNVYLRIPDTIIQPIRNRQKVKIHIGTAVVNATVVLMEKDRLESGEDGFAQLRFMKPLAAIPGDTFIICLMNMPIILGGGRILENAKEKYRETTASETLACLKAIMAGDIGGYIDHKFQKKGYLPVRAEELAGNTGFPPEDIRFEIDKRVKKGELISFKKSGVICRETYERLKTALPGVLEEALKKDPLKQNVKQEEVKARLAPVLDDEVLDQILFELCRDNALVREGGGFRPSRFSAELSEDQNRIIAIIFDYASQSGMCPFSADTVWKVNRRKCDKSRIKKLISFLRDQKRLVQVNDGRFLSVEALEQVKSKIAEVIYQKGMFTIPDCTPVLGYGRAVAIPILEYLDDAGFTLRTEQGRKLKDDGKQSE